MQLRTLFQQFNQQYFSGRLPSYSVRVVRHMIWQNEAGRHIRKRRRIEIRTGLDDEQAISALLHEMAHAAINDHHGIPWKKEMIRLREAGAPLAEPDSTVSLEGWSRRASKRHFRAVAEDILRDIPAIKLHDAIRSFIYWEGGERISPALSLGAPGFPGSEEGALRLRNPHTFS